MNETDDIFDLDDFIKKHGTPNIKKTWKSHREWHYHLDQESSRYRQLLSGLGEIKRVLKAEEENPLL